MLRVLASRREQKRETEMALKADTAAVFTAIQSHPDPAPPPVLIPTAQLYDLRLSLAFLRQHPSQARFHIRILLDHYVEGLSDTEFADLQHHIKAGQITISTETPSMSHRLQERFGLESDDNFLLPCSLSSATEPAQKERGETTHPPIRIGYLGGARKDKGRFRIPGILRALREGIKASDTPVSIEFVMQNPRKRRYRLKHLYYDFLLAKNVSGANSNGRHLTLTKLPGYLSKEAFIQALQSMDILIVPYNSDDYRARGSGIIIDGVMCEKPFVYTRGIGMNEFLEHGNAEAASTPEEFAHGILRVTADLAVYQKQTGAARRVLMDQLTRTTEFLKRI